MKILQINTERTWRGGERQTIYTLRGLLAHGAGAELLCRRGMPLAGRARETGATVHEADGTLDAFLFLCRHGREYDILHAQTAKAQSLAVASKPFHGRPVVYTRRVDFVPRGLPTRLKYGLTDKVVAISGAIRDILLAALGPEDIPVIPSVVEPEDAPPEAVEALRRELGLEKGVRIIGTVAALVPHKDPLAMIEAVLALSRSRRDFIFLHVGDGELMQDCRAAVERHGPEFGRVYRLLGFRPDVPAFFGLFEAFAMSSQEEGLGSSVLDAFLRGIPVVSTDAGGLKEIVEGRGVLCPVKDAECLARGLARALDRGSDVLAMADAAREYVRRRHGLDRMVLDYLAVYAGLLE